MKIFHTYALIKDKSIYNISEEISDGRLLNNFHISYLTNDYILQFILLARLNYLLYICIYTNLAVLRGLFYAIHIIIYSVFTFIKVAKNRLQKKLKNF